MATMPALRAAFDELRSVHWPRIVADLRGLTFIDSRGLCALLKLELDARENGWVLTIVDDSAVVRHLLETTGLASHFKRAEIA